MNRPGQTAAIDRPDDVGPRPVAFRDQNSLTRALQFLLVAYIVVCIIRFLSDLAQNQLPFSDVEAQRIVGIAGEVLLVITTIVFGCWIYRANANARSLGASGTRFSPGWSVGWYFVSIANLWKPFQAMREIWKASDNPQHWQSAPDDPILGWWWFGWIVSNIDISSLFGAHMSSLAATIVSFIHELFRTFAVCLAPILITRLYRLQKSRASQSLARTISS